MTFLPPSTAQSVSPLAIKSVLHKHDLSNILVLCVSRRLGMFLPRRNLLVSILSLAVILRFLTEIWN